MTIYDGYSYSTAESSAAADLEASAMREATLRAQIRSLRELAHEQAREIETLVARVEDLRAREIETLVARVADLEIRFEQLEEILGDQMLEAVGA